MLILLLHERMILINGHRLFFFFFLFLTSIFLFKFLSYTFSALFSSPGNVKNADITVAMHYFTVAESGT